VLAIADILERKLAQPELAPYVHTIQDSGQTLLRLLTDALDLSRAEAGRLVARIRRQAGPEIEPTGTELPIFRFEILNGDQRLSFVSNYSTFGVPYDATMQTIRIECFFPADRETQAFLETLTAGSV
jgi:signal transduction histidine kinase